MLLAKLLKSEVDFANNHGTMPPLDGGIFAFGDGCLAKLGKRILQKCVTLQAKEPANNANQRELASWFFIGVGWACEGYKAAKSHR